MPRMMGRMESRIYASADFDQLTGMDPSMTRMGWVNEGYTHCPDDCTCGRGPFWVRYSMQLPLVLKEELN